MDKRKLYQVFLLKILWFLFSEPQVITCDRETFHNTVVQWCNQTYFYSPRFCEETTILHSNDLAENIPFGYKSFQYIGITNQNIPVLYENSIANMDIELLEIESCGVIDIEVGAFSNIYIASLKINRNKLDKLKKGIFRNVNLRGADLELTGNGIKTIEEGVFEGIYRIRSIELGEYNLEEIAPGVFKNLSVENISLRGNKLNIITREMFRNVGDLQLLDLSDNRISLIEPESVDNLHSPIFLYLQNNSLETIPEAVFNSKSYVELIAGGNNIKSITSGAFRGSSFVYLNLINNKIEEIKSGMFDQTLMIDYLILSHNKIQKIEPGTLNKVYRGVDLASNDLRIIRKDTFKFVRIVILMDNKRLQKIEVGAFSEDDKTGMPYYDNQPRILYLDNDNLLDEDSKYYLNNLTSSGRLTWRIKIETDLVFPL